MFIKRTIFQSLSIFLILAVTCFLCFPILAIQAEGQEPTSLTFNGRGIDLNEDEQVDIHIDFTGSYLITLAYEDGSTKQGELLVNNWRDLIVINLIYLDSGLVYSGIGIKNGEEIFFSLTATMHAAPEPTSLTFNGRGIDLNEDDKIESIEGYFYGTECTDTCDEVIGDFDAYVDCDGIYEEIVGDFDPVR